MTVLYSGLPAWAPPHFRTVNPLEPVESHSHSPETSPVDIGAAIQKETVNGGSGKVIRREGQLAGARGPIPHFAGKGVASACLGDRLQFQMLVFGFGWTAL